MSDFIDFFIDLVFDIFEVILSQLEKKESKKKKIKNN